MSNTLGSEMNIELAETLAEVFGLRVSEIKADLQRGDIGAWDSLRQMDLVMSLERKYDIVLEIADIVKMTSIAEIIVVLKAKGISLAD